jgi:hypothetical protein
MSAAWTYREVATVLHPKPINFREIADAKTPEQKALRIASLVANLPDPNHDELAAYAGSLASDDLEYIYGKRAREGWFPESPDPPMGYVIRAL